MERRRYLVTYDVADDKRRNRVFKTLRDNGEHVQFSVFMCELNPRELIAMKSALTGIVHHKEDQVMLVDLGLAEKEETLPIESIGRAFAPPDRVVVV